MANRMLRDCTDSEKVNELSAHAEVLFYRLMMKADDYGSFYGNIKLIKSNCFPLRIDTVRDADISRWMDELLKAGLIAVYKDAGKTFLRIINFGQRLRNKKKRFPDCPADLLVSELPQVAAGRRKSRPEDEDEDEEEVEEEIEVEGNNNNPFFEFFRRAAGSHISDAELIQEIGKFQNKYPNAHPNQAGALINTWVANIGKSTQAFVTQPKPRIVV